MKTNIAQEMKEILADYTDEVMNAVVDALAEVGEDTAQEMKASASDIGGFKDRTGKYRRSWTMTQEKRNSYTATIVHAKSPQSRLTHLLEFGHATRSGGRTRAFPHIFTINENAQERAVEKVKEAIGKIK